ncbi:MAG TPA: ABC transporter ATP-binding protein, partial [Methanomassiliicoccales archaeon]|nr:ABC transporter ATP-binding protein [Methanomassiliicoccales archaeon]
MDGASAVVTKGLRKSFGEVVAVDGLDLQIAKGTLYGLVGPNGSGKTTAIKILVGLLRPDRGEASVLGEKVPLTLKRPSIGYMPQDISVYSDLTVHENLEFFGGLFAMDKERFARREAEILKVIDLEGRKGAMVSTLSGGMRHRVSLACALIHDPQVLFLDEPTVGVDPELRAGFWDFFRELKSEGRTVVLTTHYMDEAVRCDV